MDQGSTLTTDSRESRRLFLIAAPLLILVTVAVAVGIGYAAGSPGSFDWSVASVGGTAFATVVLAAATAALAAFALDDAKVGRLSAQASVTLSEQAQLEQLRADLPILVVTGFEFSSTSQECAVGIRNIGLGPAVYITAAVKATNEAGQDIMSGKSHNQHFAGSGESAHIVVPYDLAAGIAPAHSPTAVVPEDVYVNLTCLDRIKRPIKSTWHKNWATGGVYARYADEIPTGSKHPEPPSAD